LRDWRRSRWSALPASRVLRLALPFVPARFPQMAVTDSDSRVPVRIVVHQASRVLELEYADGRNYRLPFEFLRVYSPSAEVRGHGPGQEVLQTGKAEVGIDSVQAVGNYAIQPQFSDGHATGLYSWDYLQRLGENQASMWADYLARLEKAGASRFAGAAAQAAAAAGAVAPAVGSVDSDGAPAG